MPNIINKNLLLAKAVDYILEQKKAWNSASLESLLDEAGMRFNLSPMDAEKLRCLMLEILKDKQAP